MEVDAKETIRCWLVGYQSMSSLPGGRRQREAQALPLPRGMKSDGRFQRLSESKNLKKRSGSGKEVLLCILSVKANATGATLV